MKDEEESEAEEQRGGCFQWKKQLGQGLEARKYLQG